MQSCGRRGQLPSITVTLCDAFYEPGLDTVTCATCQMTINVVTLPSNLLADDGPVSI